MKQLSVPKDRLEDRSWEQYCGFLRLSVEEFQAIQNELLRESLSLLAPSPLGKRLLRKGALPGSLAELRNAAPLSTYQDYSAWFDRQDDSVLPEKPIYWAFTSTSGGTGKWAPYTAAAHNAMLDHLMAAFILASAAEPGVVRVGQGDIGMYNLAPPPYLSGYIARGMCERFGLRAVPPIDQAEVMDVAERVEKGFREALRSGVDILVSLSSVLVRMGEVATQKQSSSRFSMAYLHPRILFRFARAYIYSRLEKRQILPRDLWRPKSLVGWGLDTSLYRDRIEYYWGAPPYEFDACTEAGIVALQAWNKKGLTAVPQAAFFEFLPEKEWGANGVGQHSDSATLSLGEVRPGERYELVLTSFYGMPFVRYLTGHIIKVLSENDPETGVRLPQMAFVGRCDDIIDLAGFTRLDERTIWQAIRQAREDLSEWVATREFHEGKPVLHIYVEARNGTHDDQLSDRLHNNLKALDPAYSDLESMLGLSPLRVTVLAPGSFKLYYEGKRRNGVDMAKSRLPHINPPAEAIGELLDISSRAGGVPTSSQRA